MIDNLFETYRVPHSFRFSVLVRSQLMKYDFPRPPPSSIFQIRIPYEFQFSILVESQIMDYYLNSNRKYEAEY